MANNALEDGFKVPDSSSDLQEEDNSLEDVALEHAGVHTQHKVLYEPDEGEPTSIFVFVNCYFIVIATVLGTGILGLPVKLANSGFSPFIATYAFGFMFQVVILFYMIELLQRAYLALKLEEQAPPEQDDEEKDDEVVPMTVMGIPETGEEHSDLTDSDFDEFSTEIVLSSHSEVQGGDDVTGLSAIQNSQEKSENEEDMDEVAPPKTPKFSSPDLHSMSMLFLKKRYRIVFDSAVMLHFISIIISYGLAGSEAYGQLFHVPYQYLIMPFIVVLALVVVFGHNKVAPFISTLTFAKGSALVAIVGATGYVASYIQVPIIDNWSFVGEPFLIGTVALGGAANILPVAFAKMKLCQRDIRLFRIAAVGALFTVWILNIGWCYYILQIVPHTLSDETAEHISLQRSSEHGEISTVPLIETIEKEHQEFLWIAMLVDVFIMLSITVSFVTMGAGMKHVLDGYVQSLWRASHDSLAIPKSGVVEISTSASMYFQRLWVLGFLIVLEYVTSFALNLEAGVFIVMMVITSKAGRFESISIPSPLPKWMFKVRYIVVGYFLFAVGYDLVVGAIGLSKSLV